MDDQTIRLRKSDIPTQDDNRPHECGNAPVSVDIQTHGSKSMDDDLNMAPEIEKMTRNLHLRLHIQRARDLFNKLSEKAIA